MLVFLWLKSVELVQRLVFSGNALSLMDQQHGAVVKPVYESETFLHIRIDRVDLLHPFCVAGSYGTVGEHVGEVG